MKKDNSSLPKRMTRYAKVSTAMAGVGARVAGQKLLGIKPSDENRQKQAERLLDTDMNERAPSACDQRG
jgi:hypothetical protein